MDFIFLIIVLLCSIVIHEVAHGYAARAQGDHTAEHAGRLTLNPLAHIDPVGSVIVPFSLYVFATVAGGPPFIFGWAKPVPYNPLALRNLKWGPALIAIAGPAANFALAILFGLSAQLLAGTYGSELMLLPLLGLIVHINILLGIFNLFPIPPLDGSKILFALLPDSFSEIKVFLENYGFMFLIAFLLFGGFAFLRPIIEIATYWVSGGLF